MKINVAHVPVLSAAHAQAVSLVMSKQASLTELAAVIEADPAITLALLRFANSALDAPLERVVRVADALVRLGLEETRRITLGIIVQQTAGAELGESGLDQEELWRHLVGTAILADAVASTDQAQGALRPFAFSAGMLHDVGRLALASASPPHYQRVCRRVEIGMTALEAERTEFGVDHEALGLEVAAAWGLPEELLPALGSHHAPGDGIAGVVYRARELASKLGIGDGLVAAAPPSLGESDRDAIAVMHIGGPAQVHARIDWFRGGLPR